LQTAKTTDTDKLWEQARLLRHDINDDHDRPGTMNWTPVEVAAANGAGGKWANEASYAISLKHDFYDHEPETSEPAPRDTSLAAAGTPAPAAVQARPTKPEASAAPLPPNGPQTAAPTTQSRAGPQASGALPPPHALAANPAMINTLRKGQSAQFRHGGTLNSDAWLQLMNGAGIDSGPRGRTTGAAGLATSTVSSALAKYGAAAAKAPPIANR
ncbi:MAG TPA: hypothetical protein VLN73_06645, partial [Alphaproteobacteria bacterium]|nr:hypothetical protein [Alphaproteobacteria bacterium]